MLLRYKLFRNSASSLLQLCVSTIVALVLPPILLRYLGFEAYGIWSLIILVNAYVALMDLGFGSSLVKYTAEGVATGDKKQIADLMNACLTLYAGIFTAGILLTLFFGKPLMHALLGAAAQKGQYGRLFDTYVFVALTGLLTVPFSSLLKGLQRYDQSNVIEIVAMLTGTVLSVSLIMNGWGLGALVCGAFLAAVWRLAAYLWLTREAYTLLQLRWNGYRSFQTSIKQLGRLSHADNSVRLYNVITQTVTRVAINSFAGVAYVGVYDLAKRIVSQVSGVSTVVFVPLMPAVSSLVAQERRASLRELLSKCHLYLSMIGMPFFYFMLFFYDPLLTAWLKVDNVAAISLAGRILLIGATIDILTGPATMSALGLGTANLHIAKMGLTCALNVVLVFILGPSFGFRGILIAELCAMVGGAVIALSLFRKWFEIPIFRLILDSLWRTSAIVLPVWVVLGSAWLLSRQNLLWQSLASWFLLLFLGGISTFALYWAVGLLSSYEVDLARNALSPSRPS
jgi:O-antigen/teichoic acid export membrane protein